MPITYRPSPDALLNPCADPIFKILFTTDSEESREALTEFLSDILEKQVTDVELQPNELSGEALDDKQAEFDINCKLDGKVVNIEVQGRNEHAEYGKRVEYHAAHLLNHYSPKGTEWQSLPQIFQISVLNFYFDKESPACINRYSMKNKAGRCISETLNIILIELPKIREISDEISKLTKAQMWGKFFLYGSSLEKADYIKELCKYSRGIKMAVTVLEHVSKDEMNWYHESRYWMHVSDMKSAELYATEKGLAEGLEQGLEQGLQQGLQQGLEKGLEQGLAQGLEQGKEIASLENAKKMLQLGIDTDTIYKVTGVTKEQLEQ